MCLVDKGDFDGDLVTGDFALNGYEHLRKYYQSTGDGEAMAWAIRKKVEMVGYPDDYRKGDVIAGLPPSPPEHLKVFHAGTAEQDGEIVTAGGRVLCATAMGDSVAEAQAAAYELAKQVCWDDMFYRRDIAHRAIARE